MLWWLCNMIAMMDARVRIYNRIDARSMGY
jgi:hypothetical protein